MREKLKKEPSQRAVWVWVAIVFLGLSGMLLIVFDHEKSKPQSPHALVATAFNQMFSVNEWQPGMGPTPLLYHPAGTQQPVWRSLPARPQGSVVPQQIGQGNQHGLIFQKIIR